MLDVNSGAIHVADDVMYDVIACLDADGTMAEHPEDFDADSVCRSLAATYGEAEIREACDEVRELIIAGELFTPDTYEEYIEELTEQRETVVKAMCLHIAHDCNLACRYCFAEEGEYHGRRALMDFETGKAALDFLVANSGSRRNLEVDFFGGEPLMNFEVVKQLVEYGRSIEEANGKKFRFTLTTNGVLLNDEILAFANEEMGNLVLSIDGRKEVHDRMRPFRGGQGSYDKVLPKFLKASESRHQQNYYVRGTYTHHNLDFVGSATSFPTMSRCADVCIVELHHTLKKIPLLAGFHGFSEPVKDVPRGFVGHMQLSHEVQSGHSALVGHEQIGSDDPIF